MESLGVGVSVPTSNLEVVGNAYVSSNLEVAGRVMAGSSKIPVGVDRNGTVIRNETGPHDRPLVKYPEIKMTANSSGGYVASASSNYSGYNPWEVFDDNNPIGGNTGQGHGWASHITTGAGSAYNTSTGLEAQSVTHHSGSAQGEWIQIQLPQSITLSSFDIESRSETNYTDNMTGFPKDVILYGSTNGSSWGVVKDFTTVSKTGGAKHTEAINSSVAYKYYALVIESIHVSGTDVGFTSIGQLRLYGTEQGDVSTDLTLSSVYNKPGTEQLEVYYDGQDYTSMPSSVTDKSGNNVTGTPTNVTFDSTWKAFSFDGSGDYIQGTLGNPGGDYVHSVSWWFKPTQTTQAIGTAEQAMWFMGNTWGAGVCSYSSFYGDRFYFAWHTYNINCPTTDISQKQWNHACVTYTGGGSSLTSRSIYINGVKQYSSLDNTQGQLLNLPANTYLLLGNQRGQSKYFNGSIANFRLFSKALNAEQVKELYDYQKDYFLGSRSSLTIHKGNLGLGVAEPTSRLEIAGNERIQEYPPRAMTGHDTYMEGHGVFKARWANWYSGNTPTGMYNKQNAVGGQTNIWYGPYNGQTGGNGAAYNGGNVYSGTDFAASTTSGFYLDDVNGNRYHGAWTTLEMPYDILLQRIHLYQGASSEGINSRCITEDGVILGSANGHEWHHVHTFTGLQYGGTLGSYSFDAAGESVTVNATTPYKHYALVTTRTLHYAFTVIIGELKWFGTPAPSTLDDGHLTLGKQLTTPRVSGHAAGAETPRAESLVVHYDTTVDSVKSGNTVVDTSGSGNNGTFNGNATYSSSDRAMTFDGSGDYVSGTLNNPSGAWVHSISLWFKGTGLTSVNNDTLFQIGEQTTGNAILSRVETDMIRYTFFDGDFQAAVTINNDEWYHAAFTYTGGSAASDRTIYLNGVKLNATVVAGTVGALNIAANEDFTIGSQRAILEGYFPGSISNFKLWGGVALTADEVQAEYALGRTGKALNITDTAVCLGGTAPRAQLDVRGTAQFSGSIGLDNKFFISNDDHKMTFTAGSYSWGRWNGAHHYDVYSQSDFTGSRTLYLNYYSGGAVKLYNSVVVTSDDRIKTNERYITNATDTLLKLKPQVYDKGSNLGGGTGESHVESGLIAQDVYYDTPELRHLVSYDDDAEIPDEKPYVDDDPQNDPDYSMWGTKSAGVNYEGFIAYLIKSNQEIYTELQAEKAKVADLLARVTALENATGT